MLRARWTSQQRRAFVMGLLFISPWLIGFLGLTAYPVGASFYYSLTRYNVLSPPRFIGLGNYATMLEDEMIPKVLGNTFYMAALGIPAVIVVAFASAILLNQELPARSALRTIVFVPSVIPVVASAMVWLWIMNTEWGIINQAIRTLGLPSIPFLSSPRYAKPSLIIINCWASGSTMIILLAALQDVPRALYDAATIDGANVLHRFRHVTVPMVTPAILFTLLTGLIGVFQSFTYAWVLTQGGPYGSTEFYAVYLYRSAFSYFKMGYASALAWLLFLIVFIITAIIFRSSGKWVYYGGAD